MALSCQFIVLLSGALLQIHTHWRNIRPNYICFWISFSFFKDVCSTFLFLTRKTSIAGTHHMFLSNKIIISLHYQIFQHFLLSFPLLLIIPLGVYSCQSKHHSTLDLFLALQCFPQHDLATRICLTQSIYLDITYNILYFWYAKLNIIQFF